MIRDTVEAVRKLIGSRSYAYKTLFKKEDKLVQIVLKDLCDFCRAHETTFNSDPRIHAALEGRREVWLRLQRYTGLSEQELIELHEVKYRPREK